MATSTSKLHRCSSPPAEEEEEEDEEEEEEEEEDDEEEEEEEEEDRFRPLVPLLSFSSLFRLALSSSSCTKIPPHLFTQSHT